MFYFIISEIYDKVKLCILTIQQSLIFFFFGGAGQLIEIREETIPNSKYKQF